MNVLVPRVTVLGAIVWAISSLLLTSDALPAQDNTTRKEARKEANRFLTYLELPERRSEGAKGLLRIGEHAVPTLMRGALHPDPTIACISMQVLGELGRAAMAAEGTLHKWSLSDDPVIASPGSWAKIRVRNQGELLVTDYTKGKVLRHTPNQEMKVFKVILDNIKSVWDCERLGNGNYLDHSLHLVRNHRDRRERRFGIHDLWPHESNRIATTCQRQYSGRRTRRRALL